MRFEALEHGAQMRFLKNLHKKINHEFFNGGLQEISVDIVNINKHPLDGGTEDAWAVYSKANDYSPSKILFAHEFIERIESIKTQREQAVYFFQIMLHEMIHQYCAEYGIDDGNHNEQWQEAASAHGLHSVYKSGILQEEWLEAIPLLFASNFIRIR